MPTIHDHVPLLPAGCYYGKRLRDRRVGGIALTETTYRDGEELDRHGHATATVFLPISGEIHEVTDGREARHGRGCVVFTPQGQVHHAQCYGRDTRVLNLQFEKNWLDRVEADVYLNGPTSVTMPLISQRLFAEFCTNDPFSDLAIEGLTAELFASFGRSRFKPPHRRPKWLAQAERVIKASCPERIALEELARTLKVDRTQLAHAFRKHLGVSVGEYVRAERVRLALTLLPDRHRSLSDIAAHCGFADQSHFTRVFRAFQGTTPAQYRRGLGSESHRF